MRIALAVHGYPPEMTGGTEHSVQALARGLAAAGHEVTVISGTDEWQQGFRTSRDADADPGSGATVRVVRIHRGDLYFGLWQKSRSTRASRAFAELLAELRPDVLHVHHWLRLSSDLVARAAQAGVPAVVTLHDLWTSCLVTFRVRPDTRAFCTVPLAAVPCLACAALVPPRTPWRSRPQLVEELARHAGDLRQELRLARVVHVLSRDQADTLSSFGAALRVLPPGRDLSLAPRPAIAPPQELGRLILGSWGGLHWLKGADIVLEALARLARDGGLPVELHFAGSEVDPAYAQELRTRAAGLRVTFHGRYPEGTLAQHPVTAVHAMVSGTRAHETWGLVVDEALALRLPLVLPRAGAFPEHVGAERGALFYEPADAASLAAALQRLRSEPDLLAALRRRIPPLRDVLPSLAQHVQATLQSYREAAALGPPPAPPRDDVADARAIEIEDDWDRQLARCTAEELGLA